ncbi:MAG: hypothetical protein FWC27_08730, partial [Firmicutes bacterium]|nr:hypothetical protein [Bacillota bacterium]
HGDMGAVVPFSRIDDLKKDMLEVKSAGYHTDWLDRMVNHMTGDMGKFAPAEFQPNSLISIVIPSPKVILTFHHRGKPARCVVPPLYATWDSKNNQVLQTICDYLAPHGFSATIMKTVTQKLLAVHCGLAQYGRNNICYNDRFGSHMQIMTFVSDLPCDEAAWFPLRRMAQCETCRACVAACPTGAIDADRRYIDADRCITTYNEPASGAFPAWLGNDAHNSIVGCTRCQDCCPANAQNAGNETMGLTFNEAETMEILNASISETLRVKLTAAGYAPEFTDAFPRNLAALL